MYSNIGGEGGEKNTKLKDRGKERSYRMPEEHRETKSNTGRALFKRGLNDRRFCKILGAVVWLLPDKCVVVFLRRF